MYVPPADHRHHPTGTEPTWRSLLASYLLMAAVPALIWTGNHPLTGVAVLSTAVGLTIGVRRASELARCLSDCGGFSVDLAGRVRVTVTQTNATDVC